VAHDGFASLDSLPGPRSEWVTSFVDEPTSVLVHALAVRLVNEARQAPTRESDGPDSSCKPIAPASAGMVSFAIARAHGTRSWAFAWEQRRWKLAQASWGQPRSGEGFTQALGVAPAKKWVPSLR
jgi:hypothetical protein